MSIHKLICIIYILYDGIFWMCIVQRSIFISNRRYSWWKNLATRMKTWIEERNFCCFSDCIQIWVEILVLKTVQIKIISVNETKRNRKIVLKLIKIMKENFKAKVWICFACKNKKKISFALDERLSVKTTNKWLRVKLSKKKIFSLP